MTHLLDIYNLNQVTRLDALDRAIMVARHDTESGQIVKADEILENAEKFAGFVKDEPTDAKDVVDNDLEDEV